MIWTPEMNKISCYRSFGNIQLSKYTTIVQFSDIKDTKKLSVRKLRNFPPLCVREKKTSGHTEFILGSVWGRHFLFTSFQLAHPDALLTRFISPTKEAGRLSTWVHTPVPGVSDPPTPTHICLFLFLLLLYLPDDVKDGGYEQFVVDGHSHITRLVESRGHGADSVAEVHPPQQEEGLRCRTTRMRWDVCKEFVYLFLIIVTYNEVHENIEPSTFLHQYWSCPPPKHQQQLDITHTHMNI